MFLAVSAFFVCVPGDGFINFLDWETLELALRFELEVLQHVLALGVVQAVDVSGDVGDRIGHHPAQQAAGGLQSVPGGVAGLPPDVEVRHEAFHSFVGRDFPVRWAGAHLQQNAKIN